MDSDTSCLNRKVENNSASETLLSNSEDSSNFGHHKAKGNISIIKNITECINGLNEDKSPSDGNNPECEDRLDDVEERSNDPLSSLVVNELSRTKNNVSCHSDPSENENSLPDKNDPNITSANDTSVHISAKVSKNSLSENVDICVMENSMSINVDISESENSSPESIDAIVYKNSVHENVDGIRNESSIPQVDLCDDVSNSSVHSISHMNEKASVGKEKSKNIDESDQNENSSENIQSIMLVDGSEKENSTDKNNTNDAENNHIEVDDNLHTNNFSKKRASFQHDRGISRGRKLQEQKCYNRNTKGLNKSHSEMISKSTEKEVSDASKEQDDGDVGESGDEEEEVVVERRGASLPKIQLVSTLGNTDLVDEGSPVPETDSQAANPLETDQEDTNDASSVHQDEESTIRNENENTNDSVTHSANEAVVSLFGSVSKNRKTYSKVTNKDTSKNAKGLNELEEVITGDKTLSHEYVTKNLELLGEAPSPLALNDHGYSKQGTPADGKETTAKKSFKSLKVIYPKKKVVDVNQLDIHIMPVAVLKHCLHCAKLAKCQIRIEIGGCECHLCSEECLERHKTLQSNTLRRTNSLTEHSSPETPDQDARRCTLCHADVSLRSQDKILSWETMEFCDEDCLGKYQSKMWTTCSGCTKEVLTASMGKYCVRFGHEIKQFCCSSCLEDFKKGIKTCSYCQKDLSAGDEGFLAPIADKNQFRILENGGIAAESAHIIVKCKWVNQREREDFCSQNCLDEYDCMSQNLPAGGLKVESCGVCDKTQLVQVQVITTDNTVNLCSEVCFKAFKFVNKSISASPCYMCKKYFNTTSEDKVTVFYENEIISFCSKTCMNINILAKRRIVACNWCKVKKYNFDMIRKKGADNIVTNWCSLNCMALYQVSKKTSTLRNKSKCAQCFKYGFPSLYLTMSDATMRNFCSRECAISFQSNYKGQTGSDVFPTDSMSKDAAVCKAAKVNTSVKAASTSVATQSKQADEVVPRDSPSVAATTNNILFLRAINPDVKNAKVQVTVHQVDKSITAKPVKSTKGVQTDKIKEKGPILIPVPVPIYVPVPLAMYSVPVPTPFPFPIPIPVPIIIPTTKGTAEEIFADIKRIQDKMPGNPFEAELLMMAEMAEGQKNSIESKGINSADSVPNTGQKRNIEELDSDDCPPEKKRREESRHNILDSTVHHLATSRLSMSLKETLGVSAWKHYASQSGEHVDLLQMRPGELAQALKRFIQNARIPGEGNYTPDQKYYLMLGIQYYLETNGRIDNIFSDKLYDPFIEALNEEAMKFQEKFANSDNVITRVEEEHLWESKQVGPHSPATLLATLVYFNTKYFNLTTVEEHMQLSFSHIMKHWKRNPNAGPQSPNNNAKPSNGSRNVLLRFYPPQSSLDAPNSKKKKVYEQEANEVDPHRCPVHLYEFYLSKCPESMKSRNDLFYLSPERSCVPDSPIWYSTSPIEPKVLDRILNRFKMVKEINLALLSDV